MQKQELVLKQKKDMKLAIKLIQKQKMLYKLFEVVAFGAFLGVGIVGRSVLQFIPSLEPITFLTILYGSIFGFRKSILLGASTWFLSNYFVFGFQGPWSLVHMIAGGAAGGIGYLVLRKRKSTIRVFAVMILSTLFFEVMMAVPFFSFGKFFVYLSIPFAIVHLVSNGAIAFAIPKLRKWFNRFFYLNEKSALGEIESGIRQQGIGDR